MSTMKSGFMRAVMGGGSTMNGPIKLSVRISAFDLYLGVTASEFCVLEFGTSLSKLSSLNINF